jgi:K+-transporting ATPase ATPase B chain
MAAGTIRCGMPKNIKMKPQNKSLFQKELVGEALKQAFVKLNPRIMFRNPVMFTVEIGTATMFIVCLWILAGEKTQGSFAYNFVVFLVLLLTLLFANFAEAIAEARGKAQANSLRKTREETPAKKVEIMGDIFMNEIHIVPSSELRRGDMFICEAGDIIPTDGEIIEGLATIDESAITGGERSRDPRSGR